MTIRPLLKRYHAHVTFFITQFDSLTPAEIEMVHLLQSDGHEIGSHGALHVLASRHIKDRSYRAWLDDEVDKNTRAMKKAGIHPTSFAYPYGDNYYFTDFLLLKRFGVLRGVMPLRVEQDISRLDGAYYNFDGDQTLLSIGIDSNSGLTKELVSDGIRRAVHRSQVFLLYGHVPLSGAREVGYHFDPVFLEFILEEAQRNHLYFFRMSELYETREVINHGT